MAYQACFQRYELKYMLTRLQKEAFLEVIRPHMVLDQYGRTVIRNLYYDTDSFRLIRRSIERPAYKEKLRVRSYHRAGADEDVFVELKKKYKSVVYKRRVAMPQGDALQWLCGDDAFAPQGQIPAEITYFRDYYASLHPTVFLSYEREAFYCLDGSDFRVTFDENVLARQQDLSLGIDPYGTALLPDGMTLLELKVSGAVPLWVTDFLTKQRIYKTSFSKYGTAYQKMLFRGGKLCV